MSSDTVVTNGSDDDYMKKPCDPSRLIWLLAFSISFKLLLFPATHSTDLEVHRHWKALTACLPLSKWYVDDSSPWTLDYPPIFAYFEYALGQLIQPFYPPLVDISNHNDASLSVVVLLRCTVLLLEPLLIISVYIFVKTYISTSPSVPQPPVCILPVALVLFNPSLIIVDNLHFQYNSLPLSLVFLSLSSLFASAIPLAAAVFAIAVNTKHTFFPLALPLVIYVLVYAHRSRSTPFLLIRTTSVTITTLVLPWLPFIFTGGLPLLFIMKQRLFPLSRGLLHANWAPNFWAFYAVGDKLLSRFGFILRTPDVSITSGHIGAFRPFAFLPNPTPSICLILSFLGTIPSLIRIVYKPTPQTLTTAVVVTALSSTLFGWHVHEKALLIALLPLTVLTVLAVQLGQHRNEPFSFLILTSATNLVVSDLVANGSGILFSRIFGYSYFLFALATLKHYVGKRTQVLVIMYAIGCSLVELYANGGGHVFIFGDRMAFVPNMLVSVYGFIGVATSYLALVV